MKRQCVTPCHAAALDAARRGLPQKNRNLGNRAVGSPQYGQALPFLIAGDAVLIPIAQADSQGHCLGAARQHGVVTVGVGAF